MPYEYRAVTIPRDATREQTRDMLAIHAEYGDWELTRHAIYADGNDFTVLVAGSTMDDNRAREGGGAIFFVSNDRTGDLVIRSSTLQDNPSAGFETRGYPGIFFLGSGTPQVTDSTIT